MLAPMAGGGGIVWLPVGGSCNSRCEVCPGLGADPVTADEVRAAAAERVPAVLVLTGPGEPLLRRDLEELVHAARRGSASNVALVTNGRALAYPQLAGAVASLGFSHVIVTLLSPEAGTHDRLTRVPGSCEQTLSGISNLVRLARERGTRVLVRTVDRPGLADEVEALARLARERGAGRLWVDAAGRPGVEELLLEAPHESRSSQGRVPARFHDDEGAVSLVVRTGCRNACSFCTTRLIQEQARAGWCLDDLSAFHEALEEGSSRGLNTLRFVAVEPLEHPDIADLVRQARQLGYSSIEAWTSARALADPALARTLAAAGLTAIDVVLMGSSARVHDEVARAAGAFEETMAGIENARGLLDARCHVVLVRQNLEDLAGIVRMARSLGLGDPTHVLLPSPSTDDERGYAAFAARMSDVASGAARLEPGARRGLLRQIPPCILERTPGLDPPRRSSPRREEIREGRIEDPGTGPKLRSPCPSRDRCAAGDRCPGYHDLYARVFGTDEIVPL